jgi:hypothetical protein
LTRPFYRLLAHAFFILMSVSASHAAETFTVTTLADSGSGSLRSAIARANAEAGSTIVFQSGLSGSIVLQSALPKVVVTTTISGPGQSEVAVDMNNKVIDGIIFTGGVITISGLTFEGATRDLSTMAAVFS